MKGEMHGVPVLISALVALTFVSWLACQGVGRPSVFLATNVAAAAAR